nr:hypothetical protein [Tanacetum cinerariifolium]
MKRINEQRSHWLQLRVLPEFDQVYAFIERRMLNSVEVNLCSDDLSVFRSQGEVCCLHTSNSTRQFLPGSDPRTKLQREERMVAVKIHRFVHRAIRAGGLRVPFSSFFLVVLRHFGVHVSQLVSMGVNRGHWFSFENKTGSGTRKCFKEITLILKGWKKKFFLLDRRAILDAMPWRHSDTDLHDDFPTHFNEDDVARLSEFQVPLRPPPRHLLYMCGLTTTCRHPGLQYHIKDQDKNVISMDTFLKLPTWTGTVVSKGDLLPKDQRPKPRPNPKIAAAREKKDQQSLARAEAKRAAPTKREMWSSGSVEPSYTLRFVGIRWLEAENSTIRRVNGDSNTSLYGLLISSSTPTPLFSLSFPLLVSTSSSKVRRMGVIRVPDFSLCCLMRVSSEETWFRI